ncbi:Hypothetical protein, putative [Bodo saltans]|uniref:Uncharacterized protein n=1 Tax=Bodo saltans TaxID=75058 RepID=A0A0S4IK35_BODSA|nr:Hypothetical protein, putative [Bodo saltans]|eukprot:CUF00850.1 Hypothetical protein, putative [Bodo saltans]
MSQLLLLLARDRLQLWSFPTASKETLTKKMTKISALVTVGGSWLPRMGALIHDASCIEKKCVKATRVPMRSNSPTTNSMRAKNTRTNHMILTFMAQQTSFVRRRVLLRLNCPTKNAKRKNAKNKKKLRTNTPPCRVNTATTTRSGFWKRF